MASDYSHLPPAARALAEALRGLFICQADMNPLTPSECKKANLPTGEYVCPYCGCHDGKDENGAWKRHHDPRHGPCPWGKAREALDALAAAPALHTLPSTGGGEDAAAFQRAAEARAAAGEEGGE